ncbi:MAG: hypothetical protein ACWGQW_02925, partial [bacterium]
GTNFTNYVMYLNKDLAVVNYPKPHRCEEGMHWTEFLPMHQSDIPLPDSVADNRYLREWHYNSKEKQEYRGVCFKYDRGETWLKDVLGTVACPVLFLYCTRDLADLVWSWKVRASSDWSEVEFIRMFKDSVVSALEIRDNPSIQFLAISVFESMEWVRERFRCVHRVMGLEMGEVQEYFLSERRRVGGKGTKREVSREDIMGELYHCDPRLDHYLSLYEELRKEAKGDDNTICA